MTQSNIGPSIFLIHISLDYIVKIHQVETNTIHYNTVTKEYVNEFIAFSIQIYLQVSI